MSSFRNIPKHAVLPLDTYNLEQLTRSAEGADQRLLICDLSAATDKAEVFAKLGTDFKLPSHFGKNLDALFDCMTELKPPKSDDPGFVVVLQGIPETKGFKAVDREALLDVMRDAADFFFDQECAFRVFYSNLKTAKK
jgi:RNAse (barnase) inhibitor barstar